MAPSRRRSERSQRAARPDLPGELRRLFWNADVDSLDVERDADAILVRVLEFGTLRDVHWALETYGAPRIHRFFRTVQSPELSERTRGFWKVFFQAKEEKWPSPPAWRQSSSAPWVD